MLRTTLSTLVGLSTALAVWNSVRLWELGIALTVGTARPYLTVCASILVAIGGIAALRNRTWGLLVLVMATGSFAGVWAFGIAPLAYVGVTVLGWVALALAAVSLKPRHGAALGVATVGVTLLAAGAAAFAGPGLALLRVLVGG